MAKTVDIQILAPPSVSEEGLSNARSRALEAAVISLQQAGELTVREAAEELGLPYEGYLDLLTARHLPLSPVDTGNELSDLRKRMGLCRDRT